jgi:hypothetical protein
MAKYTRSLVRGPAVKAQSSWPGSDGRFAEKSGFRQVALSASLPM